MLGVSGGMTITYWLSVIFAVTVIFSIKYNGIDLLVSFFLVYSISTYFLFGDYPVDIFVRTVRDQITPMAFYFFARSKKTKDCCFLENMIVPMTIVYIIGFYLFFSPPSWYLDYKLNGIYDRTDNNFFGVTRMSAFWPASYFVGYSSLFVIMWVVTNKLRGKEIRYYKLILFISFLSLFFAQQRASLLFLFLFFIVVLLKYIRRGKIKINQLIKYGFILFAIILVIFFIVSKYMEKEYVDYLLNRSVNHEGNIVDERIDLFSKHIKTISFWGAGLGRFSHNAIEYGYDCISDCEYIRTPNELGIFGTCIFLSIAGLSIFKASARNRSILSFEVMCVLFYLLAMIGATPLEGPGQQPYMMWYCLGKMQFR